MFTFVYTIIQRHIHNIAIRNWHLSKNATPQTRFVKCDVKIAIVFIYNSALSIDKSYERIILRMDWGGGSVKILWLNS